MRILVIGGVAAGMSAASQAKRRAPEADVIALEQGEFVSYGACGMPYNLEDPQRDIRDLIVLTPKQFREDRGIDLRTQHTVLAIDPSRQVVQVQDIEGNRHYEQAYDKLVIATGAQAVKPNLPGIDYPGVFLLRELTDGAAIKAWLQKKSVRRAVIVGAGYIGMEMAEVLTTAGLQVTVLEKAEQVLPGFDATIAQVVTQTLKAQNVRVVTGVSVLEIVREQGALSVNTQVDSFSADLVLISVGIRPQVALAKAAGIPLGETGAIAVDDHQRTGMQNIYAAGDCAEAMHRVLQKPVYIPLGTTANKQGKIAGANAAGADEAFAGIVGTAAFKVFDLEVGRTGVAAADITRHGLQAISINSTHSSRGHHYPGSAPITSLWFVEPGSGRLLGAQMVGADVVAKRIDILATALYAGMTVADIANLDLSYAPPLAPVYDPIIIAASVAQKKLAASH